MKPLSADDSVGSSHVKVGHHRGIIWETTYNRALVLLELQFNLQEWPLIGVSVAKIENSSVLPLNCKETGAL